MTQTEALAQQDENRSALSLYESGFIDGKEKGLKEAQRPWVNLTDREMMDAINIDDTPMDMGRKIEAKLKEKNS